jgi:hypothetical protein
MNQYSSLELIFILTCVSTFSVIHCAGWPSAPSSSSSPTLGSSGRGSQRAPTSSNSLHINASTTVSLMETTQIIKNFRPAARISNIYRCASLDVLGENLLANGYDDSAISGDDLFVMDQIGLVLDLRSPSERKEEFSRAWMTRANMQVVDTDELYRPTTARTVVRIDVLSPPRFMKYIEGNWLTPAERAQATWFKIVDGQKLHDMRIERLNDRGLFGLNEAILETGKQEISRALQTITEHLEHNPGHPAIIHCVQGKDRTGMLVMLLQSIVGVSDLDIVADYFLSNQMLQGDKDNGSAAVNEIRTKGKIDRRFFSGTNERAMISTLHFLRGKYGSVRGYLDAIDFDEAWRNRLAAVLVPSGMPSSRL